MKSSSLLLIAVLGLWLESEVPVLAQRLGATAANVPLGKWVEYFVAAGGDDGGPGSEQAPWATIQKACESVEAGATVTVLPGEYREMIYVEVEGNAEAGAVTIRAKGEVVIDVSTVADAEHVLYIEDKSYLNIFGFEMRGLTTKDGSGIRFQGSASLQQNQSAFAQDAHSSWGDPRWRGAGNKMPADSPCIDAGDPDYRPGFEVFDAAGQSRLIGARVDLGSLELQPATR